MTLTMRGMAKVHLMFKYCVYWLPMSLGFRLLAVRLLTLHLVQQTFGFILPIAATMGA
jgi:hypothetical protein